jgi:hypothetical protein
MSRARDPASRVVGELECSGRKEPAAGFQMEAPLGDALVEQFVLSKHEADCALRLDKNEYIEALNAVILGLAGDSARATKVADISGLYPKSTSIQIHYIPMIRAAAAIGARDATTAGEICSASENYESGIPKWMN